MLIRKIPRVSENMPLYDILNEFQKGHSHIAVVYRDLNGSKGTPKKAKEEHGEMDYTDGINNTGIMSTSYNAGNALAKSNEDHQKKRSPPLTPAFKKAHKGCSYCILDVVNAPIPEFPLNEEVVGVISMEDVIEELLQEEILDETDEYVNIHNRIKVNMNASQEKSPDQSLPPQSTSLLSVSTSTL